MGHLYICLWCHLPWSCSQWASCTPHRCWSTGSRSISHSRDSPLSGHTSSQTGTPCSSGSRSARSSWPRVTQLRGRGGQETQTERGGDIERHMWWISHEKQLSLDDDRLFFIIWMTLGLLDSLVFFFFCSMLKCLENIVNSQKWMSSRTRSLSRPFTLQPFSMLLFSAFISPIQSLGSPSCCSRRQEEKVTDEEGYK